jgi:hypothetical protein
MSKAKSEAILVLFCGALVAGLAANWFISGESGTHSSLRNVAVLIQLIAGIVVMFFGWRI